jgi:1,4-dihydroxy-2-naphthoyl-CoA hydrolase
MAEQTLEAIVAAIPFAGELGMALDSATPDEVRARMNWAPRLCTTGGALHGGALMAFADTTGAICAVLNLPEGASTTTIESKTNFFRGLREGRVEAVTRPLHVGRRTIVVQTDLYDGRGKRVAQTTQTQAVLENT